MNPIVNKLHVRQPGARPRQLLTRASLATRTPGVASLIGWSPKIGLLLMGLGAFACGAGDELDQELAQDPDWGSTNVRDVEAVDSINQAVITSGGFIIDVTDSTTTEAGGTGAFTIRLERAPTATVSVTLNVTDSSEATISTQGLTFLTSNWSSPRTVTLTGKNDTTVDGKVRYHVQFIDVSSTDTSYDRTVTGVVPTPLAFVNEDDETGVVLTKLGNPTEFGKAGVARVVLSRAPTKDVTVAFSSSDPSVGKVGTTSMTFTPSNWNSARTLQVNGVDDELVTAGDRSFNVVAKTTSADSTFNGRSNSLAMRTYDDDQDIKASSAASSPFDCRAAPVAGGAKINLAFGNYPAQGRTLNPVTDDSYVELKVLNVITSGSFTRQMGEEEMAIERESHAEGMSKVVDASRGLLVPTTTYTNLYFTLPEAYFAPCTDFFPATDCPTNGVVFDALEELRGLIIAKTGKNPDDFDIVQVSFPFTDNRVDGKEFFGYAWAMPVTGTGTRPWYEGKLTMYVRRGTGDAPNPSVHAHELAHQLEWGLERGGSTQMLNPDDSFWVATFPDRADETGHFKLTFDAAVRSFFWMQRGQWPALTTAAQLPKGTIRSRVGTHKLSASCPTFTSYLERRVLR